MLKFKPIQIIKLFRSIFKSISQQFNVNGSICEILDENCGYEN